MTVRPGKQRASEGHQYVPIGLTLLTAPVHHIHDVLLGPGLRDDAKLRILYEFDHVGAIDKQHVVGLISGQKTLIKIGQLVDESAELLVGLRPAWTATHDLLSEVGEDGSHSREWDIIIMDVMRRI
jgi:hypothetical protein